MFKIPNWLQAVPFITLLWYQKAGLFIQNFGYHQKEISNSNVLIYLPKQEASVFMIELLRLLEKALWREDGTFYENS